MFARLVGVLLLTALFSGCAVFPRAQATESVETETVCSSRPRWVQHYDWNDRYPIASAVANLSLVAAVGVGLLSLYGASLLAQGGAGK